MSQQIGLVGRAMGNAAAQDVAQHIFRLNTHVVERDRAGIGATPAQLVLIGRHAEAFIVTLDDQAAIALITIVRAGFAHHQIGLRGALRAIEL